MKIVYKRVYSIIQFCLKKVIYMLTKKKKYLENILIFIPCPASPSLYTETRMILLKTQASIKIFHGKKG